MERMSLRLYQHGEGYEFVRCQAGGSEDRVYIHRLVYYAEHGELPAGFEVHHRNGIPWDNRPGNLEALPPSDHARLTREAERRGYAATDGGEP